MRKTGRNWEKVRGISGDAIVFTGDSARSAWFGFALR
jgi:hypothetical protein